MQNIPSFKSIPFRLHDGNEKLLRGLPKKPLTTQQEDQLAGRIQGAKQKEETDLDSINELALYNMREAFAYTLACSRGHNFDPGVVFSICWKALCYAATNFQPGRIRFLAFAKAYLRSELFRAPEELQVVRNTKAGDVICLVPDEIFGNEIESSADMGSDFTHRRCEELSELKHDTVEPDLEGIMNRDEWEVMKPIIQSRLSEKERMVLELKYQSGFNFRQIGDLLRVSRSDTQATHTRAINKVRGALKGKRALFNR